MARGSPDWQPWTSVQRFSGTGGAVAYEQKINVPAATAVGSPVSQDINLTKGFLSKVQIRFPAGSVGLLHIALYNGATKLFPDDANQWYTGDNEVIEFNTEYDVPNVSNSYKMTIKGWNEDDTYAHGALVRLWVVKLP